MIYNRFYQENQTSNVRIKNTEGPSVWATTFKLLDTTTTTTTTKRIVLEHRCNYCSVVVVVVCLFVCLFVFYLTNQAQIAETSVTNNILIF